ncbi:hypothetical protein SDC9_92962 [bioreactor metagenome]|uniref:LysR substrate-binding domain-containing protein n=1 Tax=bioreactor metagenome TaxID=1076179 RepID=A0A645A947_9ZZZZ
MLELAEMGVGVGLVPPSVTALISGREMVCKTLEDCEIQSRIDLIYREGICLPAGAGAFLTFLSERAEIPRAGEGKDGKKLQNPSKEVNEKKI